MKIENKIEIFEREREKEREREWVEMKRKILLT